MIHPMFAQFNDDRSDQLNTGRPADDFATWGEVVANAVARVVAASGAAADPEAYGAKVARRFFSNVLPYEVGTQAAFDFTGWNG
jgi:hypothetical protein